MTRILWVLTHLLAAVVSLWPQRVMGSYCSQIVPPVPPCLEPVPRDLLFVVDGSNSMNRARFYGEMLNYTLALYCAFDVTLNNRAGMIVFNHEIKTIIPLAPYNRAQWAQQVENVRADDTVCCSCCTPTAEAFDHAVVEFDGSGPMNAVRIVLVLTDGIPSNNFAVENGVPNIPGINGNPAWWYVNPQAGFNPATYNMQIVPQRANALKAKGHRLALVGVPSADGSAPDQLYFNGGYSSGTRLCVRRSNTDFCAAYNKPPFPITSLPVSSNSFSTINWNVASLIALTVDALCIVPTFTPTRSPTKSPTQRPRTNTPTRSPSRSPTTSKPTRSPTRSPTTSKPTRSPTLRPTASPTYVGMDQLDVTFLIDRSESMRWHDRLCKRIVEARRAASRTRRAQVGETAPFACWELIVRYILEQADRLAEMPAGMGKTRRLGWAGDSSNIGFTSPARGLRVNLVGFACSNNQRTPLVLQWTPLGNPVTRRANLVSPLNNLRVSVTPDGGTCPGLAIEQAVKHIETTKELRNPLHTVILVTDGVFYDMPFPERAVTGLEAYKALRFAIGIAISKKNGQYGMRPEERAVQQQQLSMFVGSRKSLFKDLGGLGWSALESVAADIVRDVARNFFLGKPIPRGTWCGWRRLFNCASDSYRNRNCEWRNRNDPEWGCSRKRRPGSG